MSTTSSTNERETGRVSETTHLNPLALGAAAAVVSAAVMLLLGVFGAIGVYEGAVAMMEQWHLFFEPTVIGTLAGMVEAAVVSFVFVYAFAWLYNAFAR
jgi:ADP-ribosylglycohydrolase